MLFLDLIILKWLTRLRPHCRGQGFRTHPRILKEEVRDSEPWPFGGDEFLLLMPGADRDQAEQALRRLCHAVAENPIADGLPKDRD